MLARRIVRLSALAGLVFVATCNVDSGAPPIETTPPVHAIMDAAHNPAANPHFYFLPPMVAAPTHTGTFDPSLSPVVQICAWTGTACAEPLVAEYTMTTGLGSETVRLVEADEHYLVNWHTDNYTLASESTYRIRVLVAGTELGYADLYVVTSGKDLNSAATGESFALRDGRTLPIKFRIEHGALDYLKTVRTSVIVDDASYTIADAEISAAVELASEWLFTLSGARMTLHSIDHVPSIVGSKTAFIDNWSLTHAADLPHFIIIMSRDEISVSYGGYAVSSSVLTDFCNDFVSPVLGSQRIYGGVVDWTHRFAACGYDLDHYKTTGEWVVVSNTSLADGSCRNQAGVACVSVPTVSYQVCGNVAPDLPYLADERAFTLSVFIHEIMHAFGTNGVMDHFGTAVCDAAMGGTDYKAGGLATAQHYCAMCPNVYDNFAASYAACP
jgi:hypothetical protein